MDVTLGAGVQTMRLAIDAGEFNVNKLTIAEPPDDDGDGIVDGADACVLSDVTPTVVIDGCDSATPNLLGADVGRSLTASPRQPPAPATTAVSSDTWPGG